MRISTGLSVLALSTSLYCVAQVAVADQEVVALGTFGDWSVFESESGGDEGTTCLGVDVSENFAIYNSIALHRAGHEVVLPYFNLEKGDAFKETNELLFEFDGNPIDYLRSEWTLGMPNALTIDPYVFQRDIYERFFLSRSVRVIDKDGGELWNISLDGFRDAYNLVLNCFNDR